MLNISACAGALISAVGIGDQRRLFSAARCRKAKPRGTKSQDLVSHLPSGSCRGVRGTNSCGKAVYSSTRFPRIILLSCNLKSWTRLDRAAGVEPVDAASLYRRVLGVRGVRHADDPDRTVDPADQCCHAAGRACVINCVKPHAPL
jgi:hypothetical protein